MIIKIVKQNTYQQGGVNFMQRPQLQEVEGDENFFCL